MNPDLGPGPARSGGDTSGTRRLVIITPIYGGSGTGAATYYQLLVERLRERGWEVVVISETVDGEPPDGLVALFPRRSGTKKHWLRSAVAYAGQNVQYLRLPRVLRRLAPDAVLVHSSFYNFPGWFPLVMRRLFRALPRARFILDVRDQLLPGRQTTYVGAYDGVIACARNVQRHLEECGVPVDAITLIPVPQEPLHVPEAVGLAVREQLGLGATPFVLYAGLIKEEKRVDVLIDAFVDSVRPEYPEMKLVLAGLQKAGTRELQVKMNRASVVHVGNVPRDSVLALMSEADLCVNPAPKEGLPRSSLEALALGAPVLLPPNVPEFEEHCPDHVTRAAEPQDLGEEIVEMLRRGTTAEYPIERHLTGAVIERYAGLLDEAAAEPVVEDRP